MSAVLSQDESDYILTNRGTDILILTFKAGVSEYCLTRFAEALGYDATAYPELRQRMSEYEEQHEDDGNWPQWEYANYKWWTCLAVVLTDMPQMAARTGLDPIWLPDVLRVSEMARLSFLGCGRTVYQLAKLAKAMTTRVTIPAAVRSAIATDEYVATTQQSVLVGMYRARQINIATRALGSKRDKNTEILVTWVANAAVPFGNNDRT